MTKMMNNFKQKCSREEMTINSDMDNVMNEKNPILTKWNQFFLKNK